MTPEPPADDSAEITAWVRRIVANVDRRTPEGRDYVLARLLYTAWPTRCGQDHQ